MSLQMIRGGYCILFYLLQRHYGFCWWVWFFIDPPVDPWSVSCIKKKQPFTAFQCQCSCLLSRSLNTVQGREKRLVVWLRCVKARVWTFTSLLCNDKNMPELIIGRDELRGIRSWYMGPFRNQFPLLLMLITTVLHRRELLFLWFRWSGFNSLFYLFMFFVVIQNSMTEFPLGTLKHRFSNCRLRKPGCDWGLCGEKWTHQWKAFQSVCAACLLTTAVYSNHL